MGKSEIVSIRIGDTNFHNTLIHEVEPVAHVLAHKLAVYRTPAIGANPYFQRIKPIVKSVNYRWI